MLDNHHLAAYTWVERYGWQMETVNMLVGGLCCGTPLLVMVCAVYGWMLHVGGWDKWRVGKE